MLDLDKSPRRSWFHLPAMQGVAPLIVGDDVGSKACTADSSALDIKLRELLSGRFIGGGKYALLKGFLFVPARHPPPQSSCLLLGISSIY